MTGREFDEKRDKSGVSELVKGNMQPQSKDAVKFTSFKRGFFQLDVPADWERKTSEQIYERERKIAQIALEKVRADFGDRTKQVLPRLRPSLAHLEPKEAEEWYVELIANNDFAGTVEAFGPQKSDSVYTAVKKEECKPGKSLQKLEAEARFAASFAAYDGKEPSDVSRLTINGHEYLKIDGTDGLGKGNDIRIVKYLKVIGDQIYSFCFSAPEKQYNEYEGLFNKMTGSIKLG